MITSHSFPETQFIAVTAYQNEEVSVRFYFLFIFILFDFLFTAFKVKTKSFKRCVKSLRMFTHWICLLIVLFF